MSMPDPMQPGTFTPEELARRRANSRRLAWVLAAIVLAIYAFGLFVKR
ncbi:MAG TPA: hypothetical protein PLW86_03730 [Rhodocyclaceae bacterium]|nr:hypothetical protein [Rhodocyclaceae bacterium]